MTTHTYELCLQCKKCIERSKLLLSPWCTRECKRIALLTEVSKKMQPLLEWLCDDPSISNKDVLSGRNILSCYEEIANIINLPREFSINEISQLTNIEESKIINIIENATGDMREEISFEKKHEYEWIMKNKEMLKIIRTVLRIKLEYFL